MSAKLFDQQRKAVTDPRVRRTSSSDDKERERSIAHGCNGITSAGSKVNPKRNYKLLIDPAIKKGHQKIYRYDGIFPGQPAVIPRDPRPPKTKLWTLSQSDLPVPRFKVDKYFVGPPPENTVRFSGLNDNIDRSFLKEMCLKHGKIEECKVYIDPITKRRLGTGKVVFANSQQAKSAMDELNFKTVMGDMIKAQLDKCKAADSHSKHRSSHSEHHRRSHDNDDMHVSRSSSTRGSHHDMLSSATHVYPTPSPSNGSSVGATPPTGSLGSNSRNHPVASHYNSSRHHYQNPRATPTLFSHSSLSNRTSYASNVRPHVEPISPPAVHRRTIRESPPPLPPPPPSGSHSDKSKHHATPPPLPPECNVTYEDISPLTSFDADDTNDEGSDQCSRKCPKHVTPVTVAITPEREVIKSTIANLASYEAISDSEEDCIPKPPTDFHVEDISADNSPAEKPLGTTDTNADVVDDNDDAMSLSSISSNEDIQLELNAPAKMICSSAALPAAETPQVLPIPQPFAFGPSLLPPVPPPLLPVNLNMPPPSLLLPPPPVYPPPFDGSSYQGFMGAVGPSPPMPFVKLQPPGTEVLPPSYPPQPGPFEEKPKPQLPLDLKVLCGCTIEITEGLKAVLKKDAIKRLVEQSGFKAFDSWWENQVKLKHNAKETPVKATSEPAMLPGLVPLQASSSGGNMSTTSSLISTLFGQGQSDGNAGHAALAKMPSFRISRKPHAGPTSLYSGSRLPTRKRPLPPTRLDLSMGKLQRLDYSDDEEHDAESATESPADAAPLMRPSSTGSALYQRVCSSSSESSDSEGSISGSSSSDEYDPDDVETEGQQDDDDTEQSDDANDIDDDEDMLSDTDSQLMHPLSSNEGEEEMSADQRDSDQDEMDVKQLTHKDHARAKTDSSPTDTGKLDIRQSTADVVDASLEDHQDLCSHVSPIPKSETAIDGSDVDAVKTEETEGFSSMDGVNLDEHTSFGDHSYFHAVDKASLDPLPPETETDAAGAAPLGEIQSNQQPVMDSDELVNDGSVLKSEEKAMSPLVEPKPTFAARTFEQEDTIAASILQNGVDKEDISFLQSAFESLQQCGSEVVAELKWCDHPETVIPQPRQRRGKGEAGLPVHKTGSARSEGFYKIPVHLKALYLKSVQKTLELKTVTDDRDGTKHKQQSREHRATQRRLVSSIEMAEFGDLLKFNQLKTRKKHLRFAKSSIHDWGLFACEPVAAEEMVIEYVGEAIRSHVADSREKRYEETGIGSSYLFRLDTETVIDATKCGNNARFINHCCTPNCYAKVIVMESQKRIVIYSKVDIKTNDEITYDYKFPLEDEKIPCLCGTAQCRGTLN